MHDQGCVVRHTSVKGVGSHLPERPFECFAQMTPDPFYNPDPIYNSLPGLMEV